MHMVSRLVILATGATLTVLAACNSENAVRPRLSKGLHPDVVTYPLVTFTNAEGVLQVGDSMFPKAWIQMAADSPTRACGNCYFASSSESGLHIASTTGWGTQTMAHMAALLNGSYTFWSDTGSNPAAAGTFSVTVSPYPNVTFTGAVDTLRVGDSMLVSTSIQMAADSSIRACPNCYLASNAESILHIQSTTGWGTQTVGHLYGVAPGTAFFWSDTGSDHASAGQRTVVVVSDSSLAGCATPNLVSWNFPNATSWGPLDHTNFIGDGQIVTDPTTTTGFSASWTWTRDTMEDEGGQVNALFTGRQAAYAQFAYKQDSTFPDTGIKKLVRYRASAYNQLLGTLIIDANKYDWLYDVLDAVQNNFAQSGNSPSANRGSWHWFEVYNNISTSGHLIAKVWLDGSLIINATDTSSNQGLSFAIVSPGGTFNKPAGNGQDWITDVGVSSTCIGKPTI